MSEERPETCKKCGAPVVWCNCNIWVMYNFISGQVDGVLDDRHGGEGMKTGAYIRVERDRRWQNIDIVDATPDEIDSLSSSRPDMGWKWVHFLVKWIQSHVEFSDELEDDE